MNEWDTGTDRERNRLMALHPGWQVWYVALVGGRTAWQARREVGASRTVLSYDPDELDGLMSEHDRLTSS